MAVRNIKSIGNKKPIPVIHFIPPRFSPIYKLEVVTDTETIDLTEYLFNGEFSDGVTDKIGDFIFRLIDPSNNLSNRIEEFDTVNVYLDYGTTATTLRFVGKVERKSNVEQIFLDISGRSLAMITTGKNITYSSGGQKARSTILTEIIEANFTNITITNLAEDTGLADVNYGEIPFWQIVTELCGAGSYDAYIDTDQDFNYFVRGSRVNSTEAVVENVNLIQAFDFAKDTEGMVTKVRVYGRMDGDVPIISSSSSDTSQTKGIVKELKKDVGTILTPSQAQDLADSSAATYNLAPTLGTISSLLLPTLLPGEKVKMANPTNNIPPAYYEVNAFRHFFTEEGAPMTTLTIQKDRVDMSQVIKKNYKFQSDVTENINPREMDFTIIYDYNSEFGDKLFNKGTHDTTQLEIGSTGIGVLKTSSGETGSWTSAEITVASPISTIEIRQNSTDLAGTKFFVSLDAGTTFVEIGSDARDFSFTNPQNSIILRVDIKSSNTRIQKIGIYYTLQ